MQSKGHCIKLVAPAISLQALTQPAHRCHCLERHMLDPSPSVSLHVVCTLWSAPIPTKTRKSPLPSWHQLLILCIQESSLLLTQQPQSSRLIYYMMAKPCLLQEV
jgi:hypothetical protein